MIYEVQTRIYLDQWENVWLDSLDDTLVTFATREAAQAELDDFLAELAYAVKAGHLGDYSPEDYRIVEVAA
jgi:hypothetical protein